MILARLTATNTNIKKMVYSYQSEFESDAFKSEQLAYKAKKMARNEKKILRSQIDDIFFLCKAYEFNTLSGQQSLVIFECLFARAQKVYKDRTLRKSVKGSLLLYLTSHIYFYKKSYKWKRTALKYLKKIDINKLSKEDKIALSAN